MNVEATQELQNQLRPAAIETMFMNSAESIQKTNEPSRHPILWKPTEAYDEHYNQIPRKFIKGQISALLAPPDQRQNLPMVMNKQLWADRQQNWEAVVASKKGVKAPKACDKCSKGEGAFHVCITVPGEWEDGKKYLGGGCATCHYASSGTLK